MTPLICMQKLVEAASPTEEEFVFEGMKEADIKVVMIKGQLV